jgi:hypothetical protein
VPVAKRLVVATHVSKQQENGDAKPFLTAEAIDIKTPASIASLLDGKCDKVVVDDNGKTGLVVHLE